MAGIIPKSKAKGVDFCGVYSNYYIIRSDLGCYMYSENFHQGSNLTIYNLHPSCQGGDHYLADEQNRFYIIKGNKCRRVTDMTKDFDAVVFMLHPTCQGGDHYLSAYGKFYIIYQKEGKYGKTADLSKGREELYDLHPNCKDGLYYWGTNSHSYFVKPKDDWGVRYHKTDNLNKDTNSDTFSIHPDVVNFLPGGLAETLGPTFGKWELIKKLTNTSNSTITWENQVTRKVGYTKSEMSSVEHNWNIKTSMSSNSGTLTEALVKFQFSVSAEYGGKSVQTKNESWEQTNTQSETIKLTLEPHKEINIWHFKLGLGKEDVLFCREISFTDKSDPPSAIPLPEAKK